MKINCTLLRKVIFASLIVVFPAGGLLAQTYALVQVIHNAADPELSTVDIYVNDALWADDIQFRQATAFKAVLSEVPVKIDIAPGSSASSSESLYSTTITFGVGTKNILMATGVSGTGFAPNPEGKDIGLGLKLFSAAKDLASNPSTVEVNFWQGSTDTPVLNVTTGEGDTLVKLIGYNHFANYDVLTPAVYDIYFLSTYGNKDTLGSFSADLSGYAGQGILLFSSGFLNPSQNNGGPELGLFAALPNGTVVPLSNNIAGIKSSKMPFKKLLPYPVPASDRLSLEVENDTPGMADIELVNVYGSIVSSFSTYLVSGKNSIALDLSHVVAGQYVIRVTGTDRSGMARFVVNK
jgi:hypothetical protein